MTHARLSSKSRLFLLPFTVIVLLAAIVFGAPLELFGAPISKAEKSKRRVSDKLIDPFFNYWSQIAETPEESDDTEICRDVEKGSVGAYSLGTSCLAESYGNVRRAENLYADFIVDPQTWRNGPASYYTRHLDRVFTLARAVTDDILSRRAPNIDRDEKEAFTKGFVALLGQENGFMHYRRSARSAGVMKFLVGDWTPSRQSYLARGMSQVNVQFHTVSSEVLFDLVKNLAYAGSYYFSMWQTAKKAPCMRSLQPSSAGYWISLSIASYAGYNDYTSAFCRSIDGRLEAMLLDYHLSRFGGNYDVADKGYAKYLNDLDGDPGKRATLDRAFDQEPSLNVRAILSGELDTSLTSNVSSTGELDVDPEDQCKLERRGAASYSVGSMFRLMRSNVILRNAEGEDLRIRVQSGVYQVLDVQLENTESRVNRKYKIYAQGRIGYVFGGHDGSSADSHHHSRWTQIVSSFACGALGPKEKSELTQAQPDWIIPYPGSIVELIPQIKDGRSNIPVYERSGDSFKFMGAIPQSQLSKVSTVQIDGEERKIFLYFNSESGDWAVYLGDSGVTDSVVGKIRMVAP